MSTVTATLFGPFVGFAITGTANIDTVRTETNNNRICLFILSPPPDVLLVQLIANTTRFFSALTFIISSQSKI